MELEEIQKQIRNILKVNSSILGLAGVTEDEVKDSDDFIEDLGVDSIGIMMLVSEVEKIFDFKVGKGELTNENFGSIERASQYVLSKKQ